MFIWAPDYFNADLKFFVNLSFKPRSVKEELNKKCLGSL